MKMRWMIPGLLACVAQAAPPVVSNIRAAQRPGTKVVDISYDLSDADGDLQLVQVAASADGGLTYGIPCTALSGAVGPNVAPGLNRRIIWNADFDWDGNWVPRWRVRVTAYDGTTPPAPPGMAYIPPGPFQMGDNLDGNSNAKPVRGVQLSGFFIDKTEVSKELWQQVQTWANANGYSIGGGSFSGERHPVHAITWYDAVKWCNARSEKEGLTPCYYTDEAQTTVYKTGSVNIQNSWVKWDADGYRLPTEAEWEKAARGGATGRRFPHGDRISHADANFRDNRGENDQSGTTGYHPVHGAGTAPVGSFPANHYGLHDMAGNLCEWCWDWYGSGYYGSPESLTDPPGPASGSYRVLRGGYWSFDASYCRAAYRYGNGPGYTFSGLGFRTVRR